MTKPKSPSSKKDQKNNAFLLTNFVTHEPIMAIPYVIVDKMVMVK